MEKLDLWEEVRRITAGLSGNDYVIIDKSNILFEHLSVLYGVSCKIRVRDLIRDIEAI